MIHGPTIVEIRATMELQNNAQEPARAASSPEAVGFWALYISPTKTLVKNRIGNAAIHVLSKGEIYISVQDGERPSDTYKNPILHCSKLQTYVSQE